MSTAQALNMPAERMPTQCNVRTGFKQTNIGPIPSDWHVLPLARLCRGICDGTHFTPRYVNAGVPFYSVENITQKDFLNTKYISPEEHAQLIKRCRPERGDILMTRITAGILGDTWLIDWDVEASIYVSLALLKPNSKICSDYLYRYSQSPAFRSSVDRRALTNATPKKINMGDIGEIPIPLPSSLPEQKAIAEALSDADALITSLEALIAKKRDLKQAAMQQLLTGKIRLPGFHEEWKTLPFECVLTRTNAKSHQIQTAEYSTSGSLPIIDQGQSPIVGYTDNQNKRFKCPPGGVIVFGDHTCIVKFVDFDFVVGADGTQILFARKDHSTLFQYYDLQYRSIMPTGYSRHFKHLKEREFIAPSLPEQEAIASVLTDIDDELAALEAKRDKARSIKQGMMQELLTGRVRLL